MHMKDNHNSRKLRHKLFLIYCSSRKNNIVIRTWGGGEAKRVIFLPFSREVFGCFPHIIVLFCIDIIRKFIHRCKMQRDKKLLLIEECFEHIFG